MIFNLYPRVLVKVGDERHVFDRSTLMFTEAAEIEKVTGLSYGEWTTELGKYSIVAVAALLHVLRKRDGQPSDFKAMQFAAGDLDVIPLHDDDREFTPQEVAADLARRIEEAGPTSATAAPVAPAGQALPLTTGTSPSSPNGSTSAPGNGTSSPGRTSRSASPTSTSS